jgi:hypothetical protein
MCADIIPKGTIVSGTNLPRPSYTPPNKVMDDLDKFKKLLQEILNTDSDHFISPIEIYFDSLVIDVIELVGNHYVVWLN